MAAGPVFDSWRQATAAGVVMTAVSMGLRHAVEPKDEDAAIVREAEDELFREMRPIEVYLYWGRPKETWAVVRPWLLKGSE